MLAPMPLWRSNRRMAQRRFSDSGRLRFPRPLTVSLEDRTGIPAVLPDPCADTRFAWRRDQAHEPDRSHAIGCRVMALECPA